MSAPHADRDHSEQPGLTGDRKAATGFRCCVHCKDDVAYHEDNAPDSHDAECTLCTQALARRAVADAVVAAGDADEVTRLRGEVERLRAEAEWLRTALKREEDAHDGQVARACEAEEEADRLADVVARVEAIRDERDVLYPPRFGRTPSENYVMGYRAAQADIRAALSGPTPAQTPQNGPEPALSRERGTSGQSGEGEALRGAERCHGDRDGDCSWLGCPQLRDGEPVATGRHCPLDTREEGR